MPFKKLSLICVIFLFLINTPLAESSKWKEMGRTSRSFFSLRNDTLGPLPFSLPAQKEELRKVEPKEEVKERKKEKKRAKIKKAPKKISSIKEAKKERKKRAKSPLFLKKGEKKSFSPPPFSFQPIQGLGKKIPVAEGTTNPKSGESDGNLVGLTASVLSAILILLGIGYFLRKRTFAKREDKSFQLYTEDLMYRGRVEESIRELREVYQRLLRDLEFRVNKEKVILETKIQELKKIVGELDEKLKVLDTPKQKREVKTLHSKIYKLWDEGLSIDDIAKQTNRGKGEIELILGLRGEKTVEKR